ncbi:MAG: CPBP family intramembrane metalloprotease [Clostridiales bacterium]|nr:CPBP family intramembrane metalloprotease [Clostridiales bacterium]
MKNKNFFKINIIYFTALLCVAVVFVLGHTGVLVNEFLSSFLIQIVTMFAIPMLMYTLIVSKNFGNTIKDIGLKKISAKVVIISIALGFVLYFLNSFIADVFSAFISLLGYENISSASESTITYGLLLKDLILTCILPAFCEEILHRGIMLHANKKYTNTRFCLIISSILFGLTHLNIRQFFYATILGYLIGYVSLASDSIIPCMIIHFMNNFLSSYFYYGSRLNLPLATFINSIRAILLSDIIAFVLVIVLSISICIHLYRYLTKMLIKEKAKNDVHTIVRLLRLNELTLPEAQIRINEINKILHEQKIASEENKKPSTFLDKSFLISSIIFGALITISSFIWGII